MAIFRSTDSAFRSLVLKILFIPQFSSYIENQYFSSLCSRWKRSQMFTKCSCLKEEENGQGKQGVKGKAMGGGSEMSRSFVLKHLCFSLTVKPWTSHLISWGLNRRGQQRCYLWSLLAWTLSGSNLNQNPEVCKGRWAILSTHTETTLSALCRPEGSPRPHFPSACLSLGLGPYTPRAQASRVLMLPRDPPPRPPAGDISLSHIQIFIHSTVPTTMFNP